MSARVLQLLSAATADTPDAELLGRFVATRDEAAFAELVRRHGPAVLRVCRRLAGPSSADDAFQAAFLVLACRAKSVRKAGSVGPWLVGVAGRVARQIRRQGTGARRQDNTIGRACLAPVPCPLSPEPAPDSCLLADELAAVLDDELTRLPDGLRGPVVLCYLHGRTHEQAAAELGGSVRTLRRRLDRAKAVLRARLERRGVVPAVAAGMVAGLGPAGAVPPELARRAVEGVFEFLAGGGAQSPAAAVAKGVVGNMVKPKASLLIVAAAAALTGLGVVWAGDSPAPAPPSNTPAPGRAPDQGLPPRPAVADSLIPPPMIPPPVAPAQPAAHRTANFIVYAPSPWEARAVANEAEFQRAGLAKQWLGRELPAWEAPCEIRLTSATGSGGGATTFTFGTEKNANVMIRDHPILSTARMELRGTLDGVMTNHLPHEVMHTVLATHFGKPLPRWADEGLALCAEPAAEQAAHDARCRELLNAGRGVRVKTLLRMTEYPQDVIVLYAQGHSVVRFLLTREAITAGPGVGYDREKSLRHVNTWYGPTSGLPGYSFNPKKPHESLIAFIWMGAIPNTPEAWTRAAQEVYGFESVDELERAWLDWLKTPESRVSPNRPAPRPPEPAKPDLIPPANLPGAGARPTRLGEDLYAIASRVGRLPTHVPETERSQVKRVQVYVSRDEGKKWELSTEVGPEVTHAVFRAPDDGLYWVSAVLVYRDERRYPSELAQLRPLLKLLVDTVAPVVRVTAAKRDGDTVRVEWSVEDANPGPVEVWARRVGEGEKDWVRRATPPGWATAANFSPGHAGPVEVRVKAKDKAGNEGTSAVVRIE